MVSVPNAPDCPADTRLSPTAQRILDAAVDVLRATGQLSMRRLVECAGVANMTPYNLFKSKHGILAALSGRELDAGLRRLEAQAPGDGLARMLAGLDNAFAALEADPDYYRALYGAAYGGGDPALIRIFQEPRVVYWSALLERCRDEGLLQAEARGGLIIQYLMDMFSGAIRRWLGGEITTVQLSAQVNYGIMLLLLPHMTAAGAPRVAARLHLAKALLDPA
ncbi:TetR/AcrR family transcriptional regulator [Zavarzinia sp. CC-PAN008]|uniref:TetR/AcrR family transcriptional regulator n=1 Tax=Zavarzinia sp. CC-PAN008 TaxID=3243332 RepID=UPI003F7459F5